MFLNFDQTDFIQNLEHLQNHFTRISQSNPIAHQSEINQKEEEEEETKSKEKAFSKNDPLQDFESSRNMNRGDPNRFDDFEHSQEGSGTFPRRGEKDVLADFHSSFQNN